MSARRLTLKFDFPGAAGQRLAGRLELPVGTQRGVALFAHCFTCSKDIFAAARIARGLAEAGLAVLRFDFTGLGASDGEFANSGFSSNVADLVAAAEALGREVMAPTLLVGHSLGGAAVIAAAARLPAVTAVVTLGAPADPGHVTHNFAAHLDEIRATGSAAVTLAGRQFRISRSFLEDVETARLDAALTTLAARRVALLICHAPDDQVVAYGNAERLFARAGHPKSIVALDGADHLLTRRADSQWVAGLIAAWAARHLPATPSEPAAAGGPGEAGVTVTETGEGTFTNAILAGRHILAADEPAEVGGTDAGPTPYQYLLMALGSCTNMTLRLYAKHKGLPLERVSTRLTHAKVHAEDCAGCEHKPGTKIDLITRTITLEGALDPAQRQRLLEIADRCPVHRTLEGQPRVETREG